MVAASDLNQMREELLQFSARLAELAEALNSESKVGSVVLTLVESVAHGELWKRTANDALKKYTNINFETPHGFDPHNERLEKCSCGHWRIRK